MFVAVLDTCVLVPSLQRDFLLSLAAQNVYRAIWSEEILEELARTVIRLAVGRDPTTETETTRRAEHLVDQMQRAFPDSTIPGCLRLAPCGLPDPDDEHVVAAAVLGGAGAVVTHNTKDFPAARLPDGVLLRTPARFAEDMAAADPHGAAEAITEMSTRMTAPPLSPSDVADLLISRYGMHAAIGHLRPFLPRP